jgi:outer membrane protein insertion porin family
VPIFPALKGSESSPKELSKVLRSHRRYLQLMVLFLLSITAISAWAQQQSIIREIRIIGVRRIPRETVLARMFSRVGDPYDPLTVERDFNSLWNTGYFEDVRIQKQDTPSGVILNVYLKEKPTVSEIHYKGLNSITVSDILTRYKKNKVHLTPEDQYDPTQIAGAITSIRQLEAEHGHQFASVRPDIKNVPPARVDITFDVKEGPKVKVGKITFSGNQHVPSSILRNSMVDLRPIGIPHSIIFEHLFARTYDASKLDEDAERVMQAYRDRGYERVNVGEPATHLRNESGLSMFTFRPKKGKRIDIHIPIEEGERYKLGTITFSGNKAVTNTKALRAQFDLKEGQIFNATAFEKGLENLRKAYGTLGYINFVATPTPSFNEKSHTINWKIDIDEGKPFYVSRIEFRGNTVTRDFVIRRALLLQEGQVYNSKLWKLSLMRLNQLDYFDPLKVDQDSETHEDAQNGTVDLLLRVHEKGKNAIGLNGGVSGLSGSFIGLNYQTNNFLGLGETLTLQASGGDLQKNFVFGFTEPYVRNKPLEIGFQLSDSKTDYNASKNYTLAGNPSANYSSATNSLLQNYNQKSLGASLSASYQLPHSFKRIGITYSWNKSSVTAFSQASQNLFQTLAFRSGIQGQNSLEGILTSEISLSLSENKMDALFLPHTGYEFSSALQVAGIWGSVRYIRPVVEWKQFFPIKGLRLNPQGRNTLGYRVQISYIRGISGDVAPPFDRTYQGGDQELRGFQIRAATPYGFVPTRVMFNLTNPDGSTVPRNPSNPSEGPIKVPLPVYGIAPVGGDTSVIGNLEYTIPIYARSVAFKFFDDFGLNMALSQSQLAQSPEGIAALDSPLYGCPNYVNGSCQGGFPIHFSNTINIISGTNIVPRDSLGGELDVMVPIINAPFRLYYAYNPVRLKTQFNRPNLITRSMFPSGGAGDYSYALAEQFYNGLYLLREPKKTFRLAVSTTF